jgi:2-methylcitrate dehydratase PrpD
MTDDAPLGDRLVQVALAAPARLQGACARLAAARTLFDYWACVLAGEASITMDWPSGRAGRLALAAHLHDQDDLHLASLTHPGGVVWSAVTACAVESGATLRAAMEAATFGYELTVRLAEAFGADHRQRWHVTATAGTIGAAGAAALLLGADAVAAVGHALSVTGGSSQAMAERSGTRFLHRAHAAETGVACARAARAGLPASRLGLEGGRGVFAPAPCAPACDLLGERAASAMEETGFRLHATTGFAHAAVDAALLLGRIDPAAIARATVAVGPAAAIIASNREPADDEDAWWSIEHAVAVCLATGSPTVFPGVLSERADVLELCRRIEVVAAGTGWDASMEVNLHDGSRRIAAVDGPLGHGAHPASDGELLAKWRRLTGGDGAPFFQRLRSGGDDVAFAAMIAREAPAAASLLG